MRRFARISERFTCAGSATPKREAELERSLELAPDSAYTLSMLAHARQRQCAWAGLSELFSRIEAPLASRGCGGTGSDRRVLRAGDASLACRTASDRAALGAKVARPPQPIAAPVVELWRRGAAAGGVRDRRTCATIATMHLSLGVLGEDRSIAAGDVRLQPAPDDDNPLPAPGARLPSSTSPT